MVIVTAAIREPLVGRNWVFVLTREVPRAAN